MNHNEKVLKARFYVKRIWFVMLAALFGLSQIHPASAHGLQAGQLGILLDDVKAQITLTPYATAFPFADENGDSLLSIREVDTHREEIHALLKERLVLRNEAGKAATVLYIDIVVPDEVATGKGDQSAADFVLITVRAVWSTVPEVVDVEYTLFGSAEESIDYLMQDRTTEKVIEGVLNSAETTIRLRGQGTPAQTNRTVWLTGIEHVLTGYDHILFILALVMATASLSKLITPLTAFTLAHTITLAAIAFGFEPPIPAWLIEATIAASIAILAGIYLLGITGDVWWVTALLGLVHGLGFGQAMTATLGSLQQWGTTLIAITVGVELTHLAIALIGVGALRLICHFKSDVAVRRAISIVIFCIGLYWTLERILL